MKYLQIKFSTSAIKDNCYSENATPYNFFNFSLPDTLRYFYQDTLSDHQ